MRHLGMNLNTALLVLGLLTPLLGVWCLVLGQRRVSRLGVDAAGRALVRLGLGVLGLAASAAGLLTAAFLPHQRGLSLLPVWVLGLLWAAVTLGALAVTRCSQLGWAERAGPMGVAVVMLLWGGLWLL